MFDPYLELAPCALDPAHDRTFDPFSEPAPYAFDPPVRSEHGFGTPFPSLGAPGLRHAATKDAGFDYADIDPALGNG